MLHFASEAIRRRIGIQEIPERGKVTPRRTSNTLTASTDDDRTDAIDPDCPGVPSSFPALLPSSSADLGFSDGNRLSWPVRHQLERFNGRP